MNGHMQAALLGGATSLVAQSFNFDWRALLLSLGSAVAAALAHWILQRFGGGGPPAPPPPTLTSSGP